MGQDNMFSEIQNCVEHVISGVITEHCLVMISAKTLGIICLFLSFTMRLPQILNIYKKGSVKGLSQITVYSDFLSMLFTLMYSMHKGYPFTIYGENLCTVIQNFIILLQFWYYSPSKYGKKFQTLFVLIIASFIYICKKDNGSLIPVYAWQMMVMANAPFVAVSRFTQIYTIVKNKEPGALSLESFFMRFLKNMLKAVSLILESPDFMLLFNQLYNGALTLIIVFLILYYSKKNHPQKEKESDNCITKDEKKIN
jgi:mannose-P-dolichol utilization defect protein 1